MLIGQELCKALFNDEYQYVLAVHCDHEHIHNHIIVNNVNFYTGKTFETEYNQGKIPERAWSKLRDASDNLCRKHHLSVVENPEQSKGKSHYEWELDKQKLSWKARLKEAIDEVIKVSEDFDDFLAKCAEFGILVDYNPNHKIDLKFMLAEQKERNPRAKFTRAKTLGYFYESKQIARRIESYKYQMTHSPRAKIIRTTADRFMQSQGLSNWADRENMKAASKAINEMTADSSTLEELETAAHKAFAQRMAASSAMSEIRENFDKIEEQIPVVAEYFKYREFYQQYRSLTSKEQQKYAKKCAYELGRYKEFSVKVKKMFPDTKIPTVEVLHTRQTKLREQYAERSTEYDTAKKESDRLAQQIQKKRQSKKTLDRYLQTEQDTKRKKNTLE